MGFVTVMSVLAVLAAVGLKVANDQIEAHVPAGLPKEMRAIRAHAPGANKTQLGDVRVDTVPLPSVEPGYLLIKVKAAAVNPSDVYSLRGTYSTTGEDVQYPISGGFEGSGVVIGHGGGIMGHMMLGQRVAFAMQGGGSYAEYAVVSVDKALPLPHELPYEQGAFSLVNPMTAVGMLSTGLSEGHNAFVQTAAASSLGKMLIRLCKAQGVNLISIVRREEQRKLLIRRGAPAEHVLVSTDKDFLPKLKELSLKLGATGAFDAVAGDSPSKLLEAMPTHSTIYVYGMLSDEKVYNVDPFQLMHGDKRVGGWHLRVWLESLYLPQRMWFFFKTRAMLTSTLGTEINGRVSFDSLVEEIGQYMKSATNNKRVLVMQ